MLSLLSQFSNSWISGILISLGLTFFAIIIGGFLAVVLTAIKSYKLPILSQFVDLYLFVVRGTPFLIQLFIIYYGPLQFPSISNSIVAFLFQSAFACALIALAINTSSYTTTLFLGAINNLPKGEVQAAEALGLTKGNIFFSILLPRMFYRVLPAYSNEILMVLKCSALVSSISVLDIMGVTRQVMSFSYEIIPSLAIAGSIYIFISLLIGVSFKYLASKNSYH
ncbi:ABC transporter permease subunit [Thiotrichales bacterium 19S3-7]|nr:ABC transporter permease subunit [Thiotrichales bacterium 19S3-7]MCF6802645.1 ABC transporter permease subunit [Thiotrichales bacterium 19S3-11]